VSTTETAVPRAHSPGGESQPHLQQASREIQTFTQLRDIPIGLDEGVRSRVAAGLNQVLADTRILHDLYKKTHWLMRGATFYQLHLLMDEHAEQQRKIIDALAERIQTLGAIAVGDPRHVAELTTVPRPPDGAESVPAALSRLLDAHERIITTARDMAEVADDERDYTSNDLLGSEVMPVNELQAWFIAEHLVDTPLSDGGSA
jgi:starvation-inducible DNA-binding protein